MRVALFFPLNWCTTLCSSSEWENIVSPLTEGLVKHGIDVVPFAADGLNAWRMSWKRDSAVLGGKSSTPTKLSERLPVSEVFEQGDPFDILHIYLDCVPLACLRTNGTPVVVTMPRFFSPDSLSDYKHFNTQAHYVAVSEAGKSCELDYVATIHPGVDLQRFHFQAGQGKYLLFMESLTEAKGAAPCIDVARETGLPLLLVGDDEDREYFDRCIRPNIDGDSILHLKRAEPGMRKKLLGGAYALIQPFCNTDPFKFTAMDALACGTPVIALNREGVSEIVEDGVSGILVENPEEIADAVPKAGQLDRSQCRRRIETRFSTDRMVQDYRELYEKLVRQKEGEKCRPWGFYEILSEAPNHKVKRITVYPGQRLSYQRHQRRTEHWYVINGRAVVNRGGRNIDLMAGQAIEIPVRTWHRIGNPDPEELCFIEVQTGDYFGEDDIERLEDDYGRLQSERG